MGTNVSVCALEFSNGSMDQRGIFLSNLSLIFF